MTFPRTSIALVAGLLLSGSVALAQESLAARQRPPVTVQWDGAGAVPDGGGGLMPATVACAPDRAASAEGTYLHFELRFLRPPVQVPTIHVGKEGPFAMTASHRGREESRIYRYVLTSETPFDIEALLEGGVIASVDSLYRSTRAARPSLTLLRGCNPDPQIITVHNGGMVDYQGFVLPWVIVQLGTSTKVCEVSASALPYTELSCVTFTSSDAVDSTKSLPISTSPTWIVVSTLGDNGTYSSTGVVAWSFKPNVTEMTGPTGSIEDDIPCDSSAVTDPFAQEAGDDLWITNYSTC